MTNVKAENRIPVTKERWEQLSNLKKPGQTFDELLEEIIKVYEEKKFLTHIRDIEETAEFVKLNGVKKP